MVISKASQLRRGLTSGLNFYTANELARQAAAREFANAQSRKEANLAGKRLEIALDLARLGNLPAQGALQNFVQQGDEKALANIGQFDEEDAKNYQLAREFGLPLTKEQQFGPANELFRRLGIQTQVGTTPLQSARIGSFDALKKQREMNEKAAEAITNARISYLKSLKRAVDERVEKIVKKNSSGKLMNDDIGRHLNELQDMEDIIENQIKSISELPDFYMNPDEMDASKRIVNPKYDSAIRQLLESHDNVRNMATIYTNYMVERSRRLQPGAKPLVPGQIPMRDVQPYQPSENEFLRQLWSRQEMPAPLPAPQEQGREKDVAMAVTNAATKYLQQHGYPVTSRNIQALINNPQTLRLLID